MNYAESLNKSLQERLNHLNKTLITPGSLKVAGRLVRMVGMTLEVVGTFAPIGSRCQILSDDLLPIEAEVVGFNDDRLFLMPIGDTHGLSPNARVLPMDGGVRVGVGMGMLGRVVNGSGLPLDS